MLDVEEGSGLGTPGGIRGPKAKSTSKPQQQGSIWNPHVETGKLGTPGGLWNPQVRPPWARDKCIYWYEWYEGTAVGWPLRPIYCRYGAAGMPGITVPTGWHYLEPRNTHRGRFLVPANQLRPHHAQEWRCFGRRHYSAGTSLYRAAYQSHFCGTNRAPRRDTQAERS